MRWIWHAFAARPRLVAGVVAGLLAIPLLPGGMTGITRAVLCWDIGVTVFMALSAMLFSAERVSRIAADAEAQEEGEWTIFWLTVAAVLFSFAAIFGEFSGSKDLPAGQKTWHVLLVGVTLFLSWLMTHVTFAFRYAHEYYARDNGGPDFDGGLDFPEEKQPDYLDFIYFALVLGMTFQVSDVQITSRKLRRLATVHGLLSFLFNTIIVALTVNIAAGMV